MTTPHYGYSTQHHGYTSNFCVTITSDATNDFLKAEAPKEGVSPEEIKGRRQGKTTAALSLLIFNAQKYPFSELLYKTPHGFQSFIDIAWYYLKYLAPEAVFDEENFTATFPNRSTIWLKEGRIPANITNFLLVVKDDQ